MKKGVTGLIIIAILALAAQVSFNANSFQGFGGSGTNCATCHNVGLNAWNSDYATAQITLDGKATEAFWSGAIYRSMEIPVAQSRGNSGHPNEFVSFKVAQNNTHLFILMSWEDPEINGTSAVKLDPSDGAAILWNIDSDWDLGFPNGMSTTTGSIDTWIWKVDEAAEGTEPAPDVGTDANGTTVPVGTVIKTDYVMNNIGWIADTEQDVGVAGVYGNLSSHAATNYQLEFSRPLVTNDPDDVQFDKTGYYDFAISIFNNTNGDGHYMGYSHMVWVYQPNDTNNGMTTVTEKTGLGFGTFLGILALNFVLLVVVNKLYSKKTKF